MLIIVDGPDGTGKTTLATQVQNRLNTLNPGSVRLIHRGPPPTGTTFFEEYMRPLTGYVAGGGRHIICDRWHLGELVYPELVGRPSLADPTTFAYLEAFLVARGALAVRINVDRNDVVTRLGERGETGSEVDPDVVDRHHKLFTYAMASSRVPSVRVDASTPFEVAVSRVIKHAAEREVMAARVATHTTYTGYLRPAVLLLGDVRGPSNPGWSTAFVPLPATSGDYLWRALPRWETPSGVGPGQPPYPVGFGALNATESDPLDAWINLGRPAVVALGNNAYKAALHAGFDREQFGAVPHPQFWRRFHHAHSGEYAWLICNGAVTGGDLRSWRPKPTLESTVEPVGN